MILGHELGRGSMLARWYRQSGAACGIAYRMWFDPTTVDVIVAIARDGGVDAALTQYAEARARAGYTPREFASELAALTEVLPQGYRDRLPAHGVEAAVAVVWRSARNRPDASPVLANLRRAYERATPRLASAGGPTLLIIDTGAEADPAADVAVARWISELFPAGEMLGLLTPGVRAAVVHAHAETPPPGALLQSVLRTSPRITEVRVDALPLPDRYEDAVAQLTAAMPAREEVTPLRAPAPPARRRGAGLGTAALVASAAIVVGLVAARPTLGPVQAAGSSRSPATTAAPGTRSTSSAPDAAAGAASTARAAGLGAAASELASPPAPRGTNLPAADAGVLLVAVGLTVDEARAAIAPGTPVTVLDTLPAPDAPRPDGRLVVVLRGAAPTQLCALLASDPTVTVVGDTPNCGVPSV